MSAFARDPGRFVTVRRMARQAMEARARFFRTTPERVRPLTFGFPVYAGSAYRPWQIDMGLRLLVRRGGRQVPLDRARLPPDCADRGIVTLNRRNQPFYCVPWRGLHYFGPTETLYEGDREEIAPTEEEFSFLLDEANHLLPGLGLERKDVLFGWAGVRPLTYDPSQPMGARARELRGHGPGTLGGLFDMTAGPVMTHRSAGAEAARSLASRVPPRRAAQAPRYSARPPADDTASPALVNRETGVTVADIRRAAREEQALALEDALFRRTGIGWSDGMGRDAVRVAADAMAQELGWSAERREREVERYLDLLARRYHLADAG